jgi:hypothetical protein
MSTIENAPKRWFILVGIDYYKPGSQLGPYEIGNLRGCVNDVDRVESYLKHQLQIDDAHILKLVSTEPGKSNRKPEKLATARNIVEALENVTTNASPGDLVHFHYSGHGTRIKTAYPEYKGGPDEYDEAIVPCDVRCPEGRFIRDVELAWKLHLMVEKKLVVTVVLDSCHSGGANRDDDDDGYGAVRGLEQPYEEGPDNDGRDFPSGVPAVGEWDGIFTLQTADKQFIGLDPETWLLKLAGYEFIAACRPKETAKELNDGPGKRPVKPHGALTRFLMEALESGVSQPTHGMLFRKILAAFKCTKDLKQTPVFAGNTKRRFFGFEEDSDIPTIAATVEDQHGLKRFYIAAGQIHGVSPGTEYALFPMNTPASKLADLSAASAIVSVSKVRDFKSMVKFKSGSAALSPEEIQKGYQAVLSKVPMTDGVKVKIDKEMPDSLREFMVDGIDNVSILHLCPEEHIPNYVVGFDRRTEKLILLDGNNQRIPLFPGCDNPEALFERLTKIVKYDMLQDLKSPSVTAKTTEELKYSFELAGQRKYHLFILTHASDSLTRLRSTRRRWHHSGKERRFDLVIFQERQFHRVKRYGSQSSTILGDFASLSSTEGSDGLWNGGTGRPSRGSTICSNENDVFGENPAGMSSYRYS